MMEGHYPIEYTGTDGKKGLYCNCGGPLPCPHFVPGEIGSMSTPATEDPILKTAKRCLEIALSYIPEFPECQYRQGQDATAKRIAAAISKEFGISTLQSDGTDSTTHENPKSGKLTSCPTDSD